MEFAKALWIGILSCCLQSTQGHSQTQLPLWQRGYLDIHYISTGVGNCAFAVLPDGTTLLIDAGEQDPTSPRVLSPRNTKRYPNYSRLGFQWQADYIRTMFPARRDCKIDYALITHYHEDHFGAYYPGIPESAGGYYLSGVTGVGDLIPIKTLIDRGHSYPYNLKQKAAALPEANRALLNYWDFIAYQEKNAGLDHQAFEVGSISQIKLKNSPADFPFFIIRVINANGIVWGGPDKSNQTLLPAPDSFQSGPVPDENTLSGGILIEYGKFKFYTSGDIHGPQPEYQKMPDWYDVESIVAPVVGEVDVTTANHHANRDAMSAYYLSILKPSVIIQEVWSSDHPGHEALIRMTSRNIWPGNRDIFATNMLEANRLVIGELLERSYKCMQGHIVLRVMPGGNEYYIYTLNNNNTIREVTGVYGPYNSK